MTDGYGTVTSPERFAVLHEVADRWISWAHETFDVRVAEIWQLDPELMRGVTPAGPGLHLLPDAPTALDVMVVPTTFPGVLVAPGELATTWFPGCGCDGCDDRLSDLALQLIDLLDSITAGGIRRRVSGGLRPNLSIVSGEGQRSRHTPLTRPELRALGGPSDHVWSPWVRS